MLVIAVGLNPDQLVQRATAVRYQALFSDAGGLAVGNDVTVSGMKVGSVSQMALQHGDVLVTFTVKGSVQLGSATTAHIQTGSLLGQRMLTLDPAGSGTHASDAVIPVSRTSSPYSLSEAVGDLTSDIAGTDTGITQPVPRHAVDDAESDCAATGSDVRRDDPALADPQRAATRHWASCSRAPAMSPASCPSAASSSTR